MERTETLIAAAEACRGSAIPTVGLCLGMQAMCVAAARRLPGLREATLAEISPGADQLLFTALPTHAGIPMARLGDRPVALDPDSHLARLLLSLGGIIAWQERMNHRYRLAPALLATFGASGLVPLSEEGFDRVVDVVEDPSLPFYVGSEGHPELTSRRGNPHPLIWAFLESARKAAVESRRAAG